MRRAAQLRRLTGPFNHETAEDGNTDFCLAQICVNRAGELPVNAFPEKPLFYEELREVT